MHKLLLPFSLSDYFHSLNGVPAPQFTPFLPEEGKAEKRIMGMVQPECRYSYPQVTILYSKWKSDALSNIFLVHFYFVIDICARTSIPMPSCCLLTTSMSNPPTVMPNRLSDRWRRSRRYWWTTGSLQVAKYTAIIRTVLATAPKKGLERLDTLRSSPGELMEKLVAGPLVDTEPIAWISPELATLRG